MCRLNYCEVFTLGVSVCGGGAREPAPTGKAGAQGANSVLRRARPSQDGPRLPSPFRHSLVAWPLGPPAPTLPSPSAPPPQLRAHSSRKLGAGLAEPRRAGPDGSHVLLAKD